MAQITIQNISQKVIKVNGSSQTLLHEIHQSGLDWMHACGGKGRCTTCKFIVLAGSDNLSTPSESEIKYKAQNALKENERLACQTKVNGDVIIVVPEEYKLPHMKYSD